MTELALKTLFSYLLGSLLGSLVIGRATGRADIRRMGSGNPGSTNALRVHGRRFALGVAVIDVGKGWLATRIVPGFAYGFAQPPAPPSSDMHHWLPAACGMAVIFGHVFPVWFGLRGGKGVATFFGAALGLMPRLALTALATWAAVIVATGFVGLASVAATAALPVYLAWDGLAGDRPLLAFALFGAVFVLITHRANIIRMCTGREPRARRLWQLGRRWVS